MDQLLSLFVFIAFVALLYYLLTSSSPSAPAAEQTAVPAGVLGQGEYEELGNDMSVEQ